MKELHPALDNIIYKCRNNEEYHACLIFNSVDSMHETISFLVRAGIILHRPEPVNPGFMRLWNGLNYIDFIANVERQSIRSWFRYDDIWREGYDGKLLDDTDEELADTELMEYLDGFKIIKQGLPAYLDGGSMSRYDIRGRSGLQ